MTLPQERWKQILIIIGIVISFLMGIGIIILVVYIAINSGKKYIPNPPPENWDDEYKDAWYKIQRVEYLHEKGKDMTEYAKAVGEMNAALVIAIKHARATNNSEAEIQFRDVLERYTQTIKPE